MKNATSTDAILADRGNLYGTFVGHAEFTQELKRSTATTSRLATASMQRLTPIWWPLTGQGSPTQRASQFLD